MTGRLTYHEEEAHRAVAEYLDVVGLVWHHSPMARSSRIERKVGHALGARSGFPDVVIFSPPPRHLRAPGVALELKAAHLRGRSDGRPTANQQAWLDRLQGLGWLVNCCCGSHEAIRWLQGLGWP